MGRIGKAMFGLAALAGLAVAGAWTFQRPLGMWLAARVTERRVGADLTAGLPDGLHVVLCGSGSPLPDPTRAEPCTLVIAGRQLFVVDAGDGGPRKLIQMGVPMGRIGGLLLTHFHSDHIDGIGPLLLLRWVGGSATSPLPVHGPVGVDRIVTGFNAAYAIDNGFRWTHHGEKIAPPGGAGGVALAFTPGPGLTPVLARDGVRISAFSVNHAPVAPAVGYRFDYKGRSVVISGDTAASANLVRAARGADLLVHEALQPKLVELFHRALAERGQANTAQIMVDIVGYHSSPETAADAARVAGVRALLLTHIVPPLPFSALYPAFLGDAARHFSGPITVGEDGMMLSLPAGSTEITTRKLL